MQKILINDSTLRDGSHAISHTLTESNISEYCIVAESASIPIIEIGHGNGLGASSLQLGFSTLSDQQMIKAARPHLSNTKLGIFAIPGFATIKKYIKPAIDLGVDIIRIVSHCTEADTTEQHIRYAKSLNIEVYGVLMMSHMVSAQTLINESLKMQSYGAHGVILMDSAGAYLPTDVSTKVSALVNSLSIPVGFHAHNNLGLAIANSITAIESGATIIDGTSKGFGAGSGNAQLEVLIAILSKLNYQTGIDLYKLMDAADLAETAFIKSLPTITSVSIVSGMSGVFSGFLKPVLRISKKYNVDPRDVFVELGKRKVVAGQENLIIEIAMGLVGEI